jgi:hypothetical protein
MANVRFGRLAEKIFSQVEKYAPAVMGRSHQALPR